MKFISKSANLNIILRPGMQAQPLTGSPAVATIFVKFKDGVAEVADDKLVEMMLNHPGFNQDFIAADETGTDPYAYLRESAETKYLHDDIVHGSSVRSASSPVMKTLPPEIKKMIQDQAMDLAKQMLPNMVEAVLKEATKVEAEEIPKKPKTTPKVKPKTTPKSTPKKGTELSTEEVEEVKE